MILYPMLVPVIGLDNQRAGLFLGGTIHDVAQVVGAGYMISPADRRRRHLCEAAAGGHAAAGGGDHRLRPVARPRRRRRGAKVPLPWFLFGFAALVALNSLGFLPKPAVDRRRRGLPLVPGRGDLGAGHEDLVQGPDRRRLAPGRGDGPRDRLDRRPGAGGGRVRRPEALTRRDNVVWPLFGKMG